MISQGLQISTTTLHHLCGSLHQSNEKGILFVIDRSGRAKAGIGRHSLPHLLTAQFDIGAEMRLVHEENLRLPHLRRSPQCHVLGHKLPSLFRVGIDQAFLRSFQDKAQPVQIVDDI